MCFGRGCVKGVAGNREEIQRENMQVQVKVSIIKRTQPDNRAKQTPVVWRERKYWCVNNSPVPRGELMRMTDET